MAPAMEATRRRGWRGPRDYSGPVLNFAGPAAGIR